MKTLALFDFDGTLYKKDSLIEFTKFSKGKLSFYTGILLLSPHLFGLKMGILSNEKVKIRYISHFFRNMEFSHFKKLSNDFALYQIDKNLSNKIFWDFQDHINNNHTVYIVTASIEEWIQPWAAKHNVEVIGTKIENLNDKVSGNFSSKNCFGIEKVNRIKEIINLDKFDEIYVYGSGKGDLEMLELAKSTKEV